MQNEKSKKDKLPSRMCFLCGNIISDYIIFKNGFVCNLCQSSNQFKEMKEHEM